MTDSLKHLLAPTGSLRVGLYPGSPGSLIVGESPADNKGLGFELGRAFAQYLDVPFEPLIYETNGEILAQAKLGKLDFVFVNATEVRAEYLAFTEPLVFTDQTYLVGPCCRVQTIDEIDVQGLTVGVSSGSTSEATLPKLLRQARVVSTRSLEEVLGLLSSGALDAFATNKAILCELADKIKGARILEGAWGRESIAIGIPKRRAEALHVLAGFCSHVRQSGLLADAVRRAGIRGAQL